MSLIEHMIKSGWTIAQPEINCSEIPNNSDTISRQAAIDAPVKMVSEGLDWIPVYYIKGLPSAQPERKTGRWIYGEHDIAMCDGYQCDKCGFFVQWDYQHKSIDFIKDYHFCPNCGLPMIGGDENGET